jgi:hypothetical protein
LDRAKSFVGRTLFDVHYVGLTVPPEELQGNRGSAHNDLLGVDLIFEHDVIAVASSNEFTDGTFELSLVGESVAQSRSDTRVTPVGDESPWSDVIGHRISSSKIHWVDSPFVAISKRRKAFSSHHFDVDGAVPFSGPQAPLALEIHVNGGGRVLLVSGSWKGATQPIVETGPGISVLWDGGTFATLVPMIAKGLKKSW